MNSGSNIPGYTGFIPYKSEFFGNTTCHANRSAENVYRSASHTDITRAGQSIVEL